MGLAAAVGAQLLGAAVDVVGFQARGHGEGAEKQAPGTVLNSLMEVTAAGGSIGIRGLDVTADPGGIDEAAKVGALSLSLGTGWAKSVSFTTGQCPVMKYNYGLMQASQHDKVQIAKAVNATPITLDHAPQGYPDFDKGASGRLSLARGRRPGRSRGAGWSGHRSPAAARAARPRPDPGQRCARCAPTRASLSHLGPGAPFAAGVDRDLGARLSVASGGEPRRTLGR